jgi:ferredoxin
MMKMSLKIKRMIIAVSDACAGCGRCVNSCPTGALEIVEDRAELINERLCDGFGSCIAVCPENALYIEEREAEPFDWSILSRIDFEVFIEKLEKHYKPLQLQKE